MSTPQQQAFPTKLSKNKSTHLDPNEDTNPIQWADVVRTKARGSETSWGLEWYRSFWKPCTEFSTPLCWED
ncbi:predicted protein [Plenodomus lingam JN3]|uniref:Predicted protein n=1 Tax=Leptosphaeria maculans (strain JN3 / isolate v23.1.3 / race Av1-4-5-6-7-8) TaxID=985895 RepID=E5A0B1_LEPMJ|nr:predicted protein [Plenodomus lingam JN3]CBX96971.1 predicted protein [Plenodomus lingam JN3]